MNKPTQKKITDLMEEAEAILLKMRTDFIKINLLIDKMKTEVELVNPKTERVTLSLHSRCNKKSST